MSNLTLQHRSTGWWVVGPDLLDEECGPYETKTEAESDRRGLSRFLRDEDKAGFVTSDPLKTR